MLQMLPERLIPLGDGSLRLGRIVRYLVNMYFAAFSTLLVVAAAAAPLIALAQTGPLRGSPATGPGFTQSTAANPLSGLAPNATYGSAAASQTVESGSTTASGAQVLAPAKALPANDLRSVLQFQKARLQESAQAERHLTTEERTALRQLLRQQREGTSAPSASN